MAGNGWDEHPVWDGTGTPTRQASGVGADGHALWHHDANGDGTEDGLVRVRPEDVPADRADSTLWNFEGDITGIIGPGPTPDLTTVGIDDDGDRVEDRRALATEDQIARAVDGGRTGPGVLPGTHDPVTTDVDPPSYLEASRFDVESGTDGTFEGKVVVSAAAFKRFTDEVLFIADNLTADKDLSTVEIGPGGTPRGLLLKAEFNKLGPLTWLFKKQTEDIRDVLRELAADLEEAASVYKKDDEKIVLDAQKLESAFQEATTGVSSGVTTGSGSDSDKSDSGSDSDKSDSDSDSDKSDSDSDDSDADSDKSD